VSSFLLFKFNVDWKELVNRSQGDNQKLVNEAAQRLNAVVEAFKVVEESAKEARAREAEALEREAPFKAAQEEVERALAAVKAEEDAYNKKADDLRKKGEEGGAVSRNKAKNELAQLLAEDPLPLRKARITLEAATKRAEKAREPFLRAREAAEHERAADDAAMHEAQERVREAEDYLDEVKKLPGQPYGALWYLQRELDEQKKFLPTSKGGVARK